MIKGIFLNYKSKTAPKTKEHTTYQKARNIGILYNAEEFAKGIIAKLINELANEEKTVSQLGFLEKPEDPKSVQEFLFTKKDISSVGSIKKESIHTFVNQPFDFLISLDTSENINYRYILAASKATCKVGIETETYRDLLLMSIKQSESPEDSVQNLVKYLRKI